MGACTRPVIVFVVVKQAAGAFDVGYNSSFQTAMA